MYLHVVCAICVAVCYLLEYADARLFVFALWIDGGHLSERPGARSMHPILLLPFGLPLEDAIAQRSFKLIGYVSDDADYLAAAFQLGK